MWLSITIESARSFLALSISGSDPVCRVPGTFCGRSFATFNSLLVATFVTPFLVLDACRLAKDIYRCQVDDFVRPSAKHRPEHEQAKAFGLLIGDSRRHR